MTENKELLSAMREMDSLVMENNLSYYELAAYAYRNEKHDWLKVLRSKTYGKHYHLICKRKKYNRPYPEIRDEYVEAKIAYYERHISDSGTWQD